MLKRVMSELLGVKNILVLNDEAHHCYREKPAKSRKESSRGTRRKTPRRTGRRRGCGFRASKP